MTLYFLFSLQHQVLLTSLFLSFCLSRCPSFLSIMHLSFFPSLPRSTHSPVYHPSINYCFFTPPNLSPFLSFPFFSFLFLFPSSICYCFFTFSSILSICLSLHCSFFILILLNLYLLSIYLSFFFCFSFFFFISSIPPFFWFDWLTLPTSSFDPSLWLGLLQQWSDDPVLFPWPRWARWHPHTRQRNVGGCVHHGTVISSPRLIQLRYLNYANASVPNWLARPPPIHGGPVHIPLVNPRDAL